ncbi:glycosyltransferase family 4 protein [Massilia sp. R2A-15]|uniref:glycosyltransferase family 4 protein n=1 Tax=Massilia sp. R2A-15 TaxID=3064278 RepID=UPI002735DCCF|nr:glycosyltransferase family 4 protein [Massilia sp. R2A-15]WLI88018.1 glycosyltransferase family 4 protein [Massilia sp. R2A-15]
MIQRPKIGLVVPSLALGGGVPSVARFVKNVILQNEGYDLKLVSLSTSSRDQCSLNLTSPSTYFRGATTQPGIWDGMDFTHVGAIGGELEFQRYRPRKVLAGVLADCDVIQVVSGSPAWANAVVGLGIPVALQVATRVKVERRMRDSQPRNLSGWWRKSMTVVSDKLDDKALRAVDAIQLENPWMLEYSQRINQDRHGVDIRYAPPGIDADLFCPLLARPAPDNPYILCVGRLDDPRKNVGLLLESFRILSSALPHVHLVTAGSSAPPASYWARVNFLGLQDRVRHVARPSVAELVTLYQNAAVFALASDEEGLGVVILEAMACGVPVVATRCGGPDGIITEGKDGFLVALDSPSEMANRLTELCSNWPANLQMGLAARETVERRYADSVAGSAFVDVWNRLLKMAAPAIGKGKLQ